MEMQTPKWRWAPGHPTREERDWLRSEIDRLRRERTKGKALAWRALDRQVKTYTETEVPQDGGTVVRKSAVAVAEPTGAGLRE